MMTDGNGIKKEWNPASFSKGSDDGTFIFGANMPSSVMGDNFDLPTDDNFMNDSFDFESASSSPEAANNAAMNLASLDMPTMTAHIPHNSQTPSKSKSQAPRKKSTGAVHNVPPPFATGPTTPNNISDQNMFGNAARSASMDNLAMTMFSAPTSAHPSRAPSPNSLRQSLGGVPQTPMAHGLINGMTFLPGGQSQSRPQPTIHKIIPGEGPKMGGIEVTILGGGFFQGESY
ncbi:hypothetical protein HYQ44_020346 [Verticillium longisporum]|nr:hypothetical protein HYQ44_020346 [Verticillium longisporum]